MAYTRTWNTAYEATPAGTDQRSSVDDRIREMKADVRQRMDDLANWTNTDTVSLKSTAAVDHTGKVLFIHPGDMQSFGEQSGGASDTSTANGILYWPRGGVYYSYLNGVKLFTGILLPTGVKITAIQARFYNRTSVSLPVTVALRYTAWGVEENPSAPLTVTQSIPASNAVTVATSGTHTLLADKMYYLYAFLTASNVTTCEFSGIKVTYNVPTLAQLR